MSQKELVFATSNANKAREAAHILAGQWNLNALSIELEEIQGSIEEIATHKAQKAFETLKRPVLTEDTALVFSAFNNKLPGPYIKDFVKHIGIDGIVKAISAFDDKRATAICTFAMCDGDGKVTLYQGCCEGEIVEPRGASGFGWDPIFQPNGFTKTFAEMSEDEKNSTSHRKRALEKLKDSTRLG